MDQEHVLERVGGGRSAPYATMKFPVPTQGRAGVSDAECLWGGLAARRNFAGLALLGRITFGSRAGPGLESSATRSFLGARQTSDQVDGS